MKVWRNYELLAWGRDEVKPVTGSWDDFWGGFGVTLVDGLDTLHLMGFEADGDRSEKPLGKAWPRHDGVPASDHLGRKGQENLIGEFSPRPSQNVANTAGTWHVPVYGFLPGRGVPAA